MDWLSESEELVAKLITIGDSISQGFMSGGAARTDLSYSTLIAQSLGIQQKLPLSELAARRCPVKGVLKFPVDAAGK